MYYYCEGKSKYLQPKTITKGKDKDHKSYGSFLLFQKLQKKISRLPLDKEDTLWGSLLSKQSSNNTHFNNMIVSNNSNTNRSPKDIITIFARLYVKGVISVVAKSIYSDDLEIDMEDGISEYDDGENDGNDYDDSDAEYNGDDVEDNDMNDDDEDDDNSVSEVGTLTSKLLNDSLKKQFEEKSPIDNHDERSLPDQSLNIKNISFPAHMSSHKSGLSISQHGKEYIDDILSPVNKYDREYSSKSDISFIKLSPRQYATDNTKYTRIEIRLNSPLYGACNNKDDKQKIYESEIRKAIYSHPKDTSSKNNNNNSNNSNNNNNNQQSVAKASSIMSPSIMEFSCPTPPQSKHLSSFSTNLYQRKHRNIKDNNKVLFSSPIGTIDELSIENGSHNNSLAESTTLMENTAIIKSQNQHEDTEPTSSIQILGKKKQISNSGPESNIKKDAEVIASGNVLVARIPTGSIINSDLDNSLLPDIIADYTSHIDKHQQDSYPNSQQLERNDIDSGYSREQSPDSCRVNTANNRTDYSNLPEDIKYLLFQDSSDNQYSVQPTSPFLDWNIVPGSNVPEPSFEYISKSSWHAAPTPKIASKLYGNDHAQSLHKKQLSMTSPYKIQVLTEGMHNRRKHSPAKKLISESQSPQSFTHDLHTISINTKDTSTESISKTIQLTVNVPQPINGKKIKR
jgi:hypothetical protein